MSNTTNVYGTSSHAIEDAYDEAIEKLHQVADVKSDISFTGIFANLIKKMDDTSQAAV